MIERHPNNTNLINFARLTCEFRHYPCSNCKDVHGRDFTVAHGPELVDVGRLTLRAALDDTLARVVVFVGLRLAVIGDRLDTTRY